MIFFSTFQKINFEIELLIFKVSTVFKKVEYGIDHVCTLMREKNAYYENNKRLKEFHYTFKCSGNKVIICNTEIVCFTHVK